MVQKPRATCLRTESKPNFSEASPGVGQGSEGRGCGCSTPKQLPSKISHSKEKQYEDLNLALPRTVFVSLDKLLNVSECAS